MVKLPSSPKGPSEALRAAIERTFEATAGSAASTRDRAAELVDEVTRRGREVGSQLGREVGSQLGKVESTVRRRKTKG
jgi:polyhydroxyalkanoate synthesis regulator phasin